MQNDATRLSDRELKLFKTAMQLRKQLDRIYGSFNGDEVLARELAEKLGFEISEEDIKLLCPTREL